MVIGTYSKFMPQAPAAPPLERLDKATLPGATDRAGGTSGASFSNLLEKSVSEIDNKMKTAGTEQQKLLTGETNNVHQAMIAVQEASVAFSLMVEVRNKLVESYQEIMRMQV